MKWPLFSYSGMWVMVRYFVICKFPELMNAPKDIFSAGASSYAKYRPLYPDELYSFLFQHVGARNEALDCGTGNGQAAEFLSRHFKKVFATDISERQIAEAPKKKNISYSIARAEELPFEDHSFDLIVSATAIHWFDFPKFFPEVKRVARNNAVFACWAYSLLQTENQRANELIDRFYFEKVNGYWDPERKYVDEEYRTIPFPFEEIITPAFATKLSWTLAQLEGYINTWSAVQHYLEKNGRNPVTELIGDIRNLLNGQSSFEISFPVFMRMGKIKK
jgi:SAM-dependent methyltransferase